IPWADLVHALRSKAVLLNGVRVTAINEKSRQRHEWQYDDGLRGYLQEAMQAESLLLPLFEGKQYAENADEQHAPGEGAHWVVAWTAEGPVVRESYVNLISTPAGGTHEAGLRDGLFQALKAF